MKRYSTEIKKKIVTAHIQDGRTIASLATEYGVSTASINNWIRDYRKEWQASPEAISDLELMEENRKLKQNSFETHHLNCPFFCQSFKIHRDYQWCIFSIISL